MKKYYEQPKGMVDDTPARAKPTPARRTPPTAQADQQVKVIRQPEVQVMTPMAPSAEPQQEAKKIVTPEVNPESKQVGTFKPKTTTTAKSGIDAALDGLE